MKRRELIREHTRIRGEEHDLMRKRISERPLSSYCSLVLA